MFAILARMDASRAATVTALRSRIAALGGMSPAAPRPVRPPQPPLAERAAALGFAAEPSGAGTAWVRRVRVDLEPLFARAGLEDPVPPGALLDLLGVAAGEDEPAWLDAEGVGVLDIETLGLHGSGVMAFLVAAGVQRGGILAAEQLLLVEPDDEGGLLTAVAARIGAHRLWLTYNGRSFDIPVLAARCTLNRLDPACVHPRLHGDLLGPVRRLFGDRLAACTLRQAERSLLGHHRVGDVPGSEAGARYRAWLNGAPATVLEGVVAHNLQDIVSTAVVGSRLAAHVHGDRVRPAHAADPYHLARHLQRRGLAEAAEAELRDAVDAGVEPWARRAAHSLALTLQRRGALDEALHLWARLHRENPRDLPAARAYAIRLERAGDLEAALDVCGRVFATRSELGPWWHRLRGGGPAGESEWRRREARLRVRVLRRMGVVAGGDGAATGVRRTPA